MAIGKTNSQVIVGGGGGGAVITGDGEFLVKVIDYDGTLLKGEYLDTNETFTLPEPPEHEGLTFDGWSSSKAIVDNTVTVTDNDIMIAPMYKTTSGKVEIDIYAPAKAISVSCNAGVEIDWGDGTVDNNSSHIYAAEGLYTIKFAKSGAASTFNINSYLIKAIRLPNTITSIGNNAFNICYSLTTITMPSSITTINSGAFYDCYSLATAIIPSSVTSINGSAFQDCYSLATAIIPSSITTIGSSSFYGCYSLATAIIPSSVTEIGSYAFNNCYSLTAITMPSSITTIGSSSFYGCYSLATAIISSGAASTGGSSFYNCYSLTSVIIPSNVTSISSSTFRGCSLCSIFDFRNHTAVPSLINTSAFSSTTGKIVVPDSLYSSWIGASNWSSLTSQIMKATDWEAL